MMKIIWLINITMPDACVALGKPAQVLGGWLTGYRDALLSNHPDVELHIVEPYWGTQTAEASTLWQGHTIRHHLYPEAWMNEAKNVVTQSGAQLTARSNRMAAWMSEMYEQVRPDVVHLHGTEFAHTTAWIQTCGTEHTLVSIQGLTSVISRYYKGGLTEEELKGCWSVNDWRFGRTLDKEQRQMAERGRWEKLSLSRVSHIAGRTSWDKAHAWALNPQARYHVLQEVLRAPFYDTTNRWTLPNCKRHTIFMSQSHFAIKGLHRLLDALKLVLRQYPDTQVLIVGDNRLDEPWQRRSAYVNVLRRKAEGLRDHIHYLGTLTAEQMVEQYRRAHVFVCPSAIENSSNSVCEAQLLGTPVVASYVGGMMDLVQNEVTGLLYRYEEVEMLAYAICRIFGDDDLATRLGSHAAQQAMARHDRQAIAHTLYNIYKQL